MPTKITSLAHLITEGLDNPKLLGYVFKTMSVDESGDASFDMFLQETKPVDNKMIAEVYVDYLVWASGPYWKDFLDAAESGDVPQNVHTWIVRDLDDYWEVTCDRVVYPIERLRTEQQIAVELKEEWANLSFDWRDDQVVEVIPKP